MVRNDDTSKTHHGYIHQVVVRFMYASSNFSRYLENRDKERALPQFVQTLEQFAFLVGVTVESPAGDRQEGQVAPNLNAIPAEPSVESEVEVLRKAFIRTVTVVHRTCQAAHELALAARDYALPQDVEYPPSPFWCEPRHAHERRFW